MAGDARREALLQERILEHYRRPRGRAPLARVDACVEHRNPLCGDEIDVELARAPGEPDRIEGVRLVARGCSLAVAAASMLAERAAGMTAAELAALHARYARLLDGRATPEDEAALGELASFAGVVRVPGRRRCAELAFEAVERTLKAER